jgi:hypothetical protein
MIAKSHETNLVTALSAKAPNVEVTLDCGRPRRVERDPHPRDSTHWSGTGEPLFVVGRHADRQLDHADIGVRLAPASPGSKAPRHPTRRSTSIPTTSRAWRF